MKQLFIPAALGVAVVGSFFTAPAYAQANDPSGGLCAGEDISGPLFAVCIQAHSAARLVEHLEAVGANANAVTKAELQLEAALSSYRELSGGGSVPGIEAGETILAVAYIDRLDNGDNYDAAVDTLIAKWIDTNSNGVPDVGDDVVTHQYPIDLDATGVGNFQNTKHYIDSSYDILAQRDGFSGNPIILFARKVFTDGTDQSWQFIGGPDGGAHYFSDAGRGDGAGAPFTVFSDQFGQGAIDYIEVSGGSQAAPDIEVQPTERIQSDCPCDDPFIDVDLLF